MPKGTKAGNYRGLVTIKASGKTIGRIPISLRVYDVTLPDDPVFRTIITFSPEFMFRYEKRPQLEIVKDISIVLAEHGIRGYGARIAVDAKILNGKVICDFTKFDERISWVLDNLRFNAFFLGPLFGGGTGEGWGELHRKWLGMELLSEDFNKYFPDYMCQIGQHLREKVGWMLRVSVMSPNYYFDKVYLAKLALQILLKIWEILVLLIVPSGVVKHNGHLAAHT